jgi:hypothetical protein
LQTKKSIKKQIFNSNLFKNKYIFKIFKTNDYLNYLAKFVEQNFSKTHFDATEGGKTQFFVTTHVKRVSEIAFFSLFFFIEFEITRKNF